MSRNNFTQGKFQLATRIFFLVFAAVLSTTSVAAQDDFFKQMLDYSRPGENHKILENLVGSWKYKVGHPDSTEKVKEYQYGTFVWTSFANGRFFRADARSSQIQMPIQDGKFKEANYQAFYTIGYNNVKKRYEEAVIGNMIGSDIMFATGTYDSSKNSITFESEVESVPGASQRTRDVFTFIDHDHYNIESFDERDGRFVMNTKAEFTRIAKQ